MRQGDQEEVKPGFMEAPIRVWQDGEMWAAHYCEERMVHAKTRDEVIFWAGWWVGRRSIGKLVAEHVEKGEGEP
jgi:hypothetical protein